MSRAAVPIPRAGPGYATALAAAGAGAVLLGAIAGTYPKYALALAVGAIVVALTFRFPVGHLLALLFVTAVVPLTVQSQFGSGGSVRAAGVIPTDLLVLAGLLRAIVVLPHLPVNRRVSRAMVVCAAFLAVVSLQLLHALLLGRSISGVGAEARVLLGFGTALVALPVLADPDQRARLLRGLLWVGLVLGIWGIAQFALDLRYDLPPDLGGGSVNTFNTAGRVVGMYAFPVAALMALSVLASGAVRGTRARLALAAVVGLNLASLTLTFERTFFIALVVGVIGLLVGTGGPPRRRLLAWAPGMVLATLVTLSLFAPAALDATSQRLASLGKYESDPSVTYRREESRMVAERVKAHPVTGSGLGASILIGRPGTNRPIIPRRYAENGYLWLVWKLGIVGAAFLLGLLAAAILTRPRAREPLERAVIAGAKASLLALAVATIAFPSFNQLAITPAIGLLVALALAPDPVRRSS